MNPYLALVLTICTGGLFGLFYASKVSSAYAKRAAARKTDAAGRTLGRARHPVAVMVLSYLTGGIYFSYWTYRVMQECGVYTSGRACESRSEMTLMLCFPPYAAYTALFRLPDLIKAVRKAAGSPEFSALGAVPFFLNPCMWPLHAVPRHDLPGRSQSGLVHRPMTRFLQVRPFSHPSQWTSRLCDARLRSGRLRNGRRLEPDRASGADVLSAAAKRRPALSDVRHDARRRPVRARPVSRSDMV